MNISQGFMWIFVFITGWIGVCMLMDKAFPKKEKTYLSAWYGEVHWEVPYELPEEYDNPYDPGKYNKFVEPEEKGAE